MVLLEVSIPQKQYYRVHFVLRWEQETWKLCSIVGNLFTSCNFGWDFSQNYCPSKKHIKLKLPFKRQNDLIHSVDFLKIFFVKFYQDSLTSHLPSHEKHFKQFRGFLLWRQFKCCIRSTTFAHKWHHCPCYIFCRLQTSVHFFFPVVSAAHLGVISMETCLQGQQDRLKSQG